MLNVFQRRVVCTQLDIYVFINLSVTVNADITISHILNSLFSKESVIWETTDKIDRVITISYKL